MSNELDHPLSDATHAEYLAVLCAAGGSSRRAAKLLKDRGHDVTYRDLDALRDEHSGVYLAIAAEQTRAQEEAIAQEFREIVQGSNRLTRTFVETLTQRMDDGDVMPRDMPQIVQALAKVTQVSTDKLLALTGRPVNGQANDPLGATRELMEMGLLTAVEKPGATDTTAEEIEDNE